jgi:MOSC domain-containing protein YiiM
LHTEHCHLLSIQVGMPQELGSGENGNPDDVPFMSGIIKRSVTGPVFCKKLNLVGDAQADLVHHGGLDKAVLFYDADHYPAWRTELNLLSLPFGGFGENFTAFGLTESTVCVGDKYAIGDALFEISQPRRPCWKLDKRWNRDDLLRLVEEKAWSGWYARVLVEGTVAAGDDIRLVDRPMPELTIEYVTRVVQQRKFRHAEAKRLVDCLLLSESIRSTLRKSLNR